MAEAQAGADEAAPGQPPPIRRLEEAVVNRIAAGEVIQRPASALKEMLENSLDAGATSINVVVKDGGLKMIQITDNGHGIRYEDLPILCERHTTSKLREYEDLQAINTLGFRGEALASITFVAHLTVVTMMEGQTHGYKATYKDSKMEGEARPCAAVKGTQITVENLFYNVPTRKKAFKNPGEEYGRILDVISRYAVHNSHVSFTCKKHGDSRTDIHTVAPATTLEAVRSVYGPAVARELIPLSASDNDPTTSRFKMEGFLSSANYSAKKTTLVLFINNRLVECSPLKKACEAVYAAILPKASKPFLYMKLELPAEDVDVNVHPTKREVSFLNQESLIESIQKAVEEKLLESNTSRTFYTQTLLPGAQVPDREEEPSSQKPINGSQPPKAAEQRKLVRTDELNPAGRMHAFLQSKHQRPTDEANELTATRRVVRQRRNPAECAELTSIQELLEAIDFQTHAGLTEIVKHHMYVGMADETLALLQHKTKLYLANVVTLSKELVYQQVLRRFARFNSVRLSSPAPLYDLSLMALEEEEHNGWHPSDGTKEEIAQAHKELLVLKADMLREYFSIDIDADGNLLALPIVLDQYTPDMDRLPQFVLALANTVEWDSEKECFDTLSAAVAEFYASHPPLLPRPSPKRRKKSAENQNHASSLEPSPPPPTTSAERQASEREASASGDGEGGAEAEAFPDSMEGGRGEERAKEGAVDGEGGEGGGGGSGSGGKEEEGGGCDELEDELAAEAESAWQQRDWTIQHLLFPAMRLFLKPPNSFANDGTFVQVACLENLYRIFERC